MPDGGIKYGTGVFFNNQGQLITCAHTVFMSIGVTVRTSDTMNYTAKIKTQDEGKDLAVLELYETPNKRFKGNKSYAVLSKTLPKQGTIAYIISNPRGFTFSFDRVVVAGIREFIDFVSSAGPAFLIDAIQLNREMIGGVSGAGLFDKDNKLLGIFAFSYQVTPSFAINSQEIRKHLEVNGFLPHPDPKG